MIARTYVFYIHIITYMKYLHIRDNFPNADGTDSI